MGTQVKTVIGNLNIIALLIILSPSIAKSDWVTVEWINDRADGGQVTVESRLEFEQVEADYRRTDDGVIFRFRAGTATATPWLDDETMEAIKIISERLP